ncbi:MAG TPA: transglutaminase-like domain-containing protein [Myxococcales bacterium]|nr:transglutaminase-like domain-containing protein [Myxococcales bacterium]
MDGADLSRLLLQRALAQQPADLARAALAVAREEYPELDEAAYLGRLDELAAGVLSGLPAGASAQRRVGRINAWLFHEQGFSGNRDDYYDPRNSYLNEVLDRRLGIPLTLCIVYMEVGKRCGLRVEGVGFPGHFLCKVQLDDGELVVDPFHRGQLLGVAQLKQRLAAAVGDRVPFDPRILRAAQPREILVRMLQNLRSVYQGRNDMPRALSAVDRLLLLQPGNTRGLRERAQIRELLGGGQGAAADLEKVLQLEPNAADAPALRARVRKLRDASKFLN